MVQRCIKSDERNKVFTYGDKKKCFKENHRSTREEIASTLSTLKITRVLLGTPISMIEETLHLEFCATANTKNACLTS